MSEYPVYFFQHLSKNLRMICLDQRWCNNSRESNVNEIFNQITFPKLKQLHLISMDYNANNWQKRTFSRLRHLEVDYPFFYTILKDKELKCLYDSKISQFNSMLDPHLSYELQNFKTFESMSKTLQKIKFDGTFSESKYPI